MEYREIPLESLLLDALNPRHDPVESQREALRALLRDRGGRQLLRLAKDIAEFGPSPIELALVIPDGSTFIVVEGNRRVAAMKLLRNPGLAEGTGIGKPIRELSRQSQPSTHMACMVADSRDDARRWIEIRHNGLQSGLGIVEWSPEMQVRFTQNFAGQRGRAVRLTDALEEAYQADDELRDLIQQVKAAKITTLGRIISDPDFRRAAGLEISGDVIRSHFGASAARNFWYRLFSDLSAELTVSALKSKQQRASYLASIADSLPSAEQRRSELGEIREPTEPAAASGPSTSQAPTPTKRPQRTQRQRPLRLFAGLSLRNVRPRTRDILREAQRIDLTQFPNAAAVLIRVIVELVVAEASDYYGLPEKPLRERITSCLNRLDPSGKAEMYAAIRRGLSERDGLLSVRSMHAYVHSRHTQPDAASLRGIAENYAPFVRDLDNAIGNGTK